MTDPIVPDATTQRPSEKRMRLRFAGSCRCCQAALDAGTLAVWERATKTVRCVACEPSVAPGDDVRATPVAVAPRMEPVPQVDASAPSVVSEPVEAAVGLDSGVAGASARREYERRKSDREQRVRGKYPRVGGLLLAITEDPQSTTAWDTGAVGEEKVGARLDKLQAAHPDQFAVLHDRRIPRSRANIDHLVVTSSGVWVIDPKRYRGRPARKVEGDLFRARTEMLTVGGRDRTSLVEGVLKQIALVRVVVPAEVPVRGALCFVDADWSLLDAAFKVRDVDVVWPRKLVSGLQDDRGGAVDVLAIARLLAEHFAPA